MFKKFITLIFIFSFITYAQSDSLQIETEQAIEDLSDEPEEEAENSDLYEEIEFYTDHPVNLNTATVEELAIVPYFNSSIAQKIIDYKKKYGPFFSVNELYSISEIPENLIRKSLIFVTVTLPEVKGNAMAKEFPPSISIKLRNRLLYDLQSARGFKENAFRGSPYKLYNRIKINYANNISTGILLDKDAGESSYSDFSSGYFLISNWMNITNLIFGDFIAEFGQGLALWNSSAFSKSSNAIYQIRKYSGEIRPYSSSTENNFFRGAAIEKKWEHIKFTGFFSRNHLDANKDSISGFITSLPTDGLHRTNNEILKRKSVIETAYGISLKAEPFKLFSLGLLYYNAYYNHPFFTSNLYELKGNNFNYYSSYFNLYSKNCNLFGEITFDGKSVASFGGINYSFSPDFVYSIAIRNYPRNYINLHGNGFGEKRRSVNNEIGIYNGIFWSTLAGIINFYFDQFKFPYAYYNNPLPSEGNEFMFCLNNNSFKKFELILKYKLENKEVTQEVNNQDELVRRLKHTFRTELIYNISTKLRLKTRLEYLKLFIRNANTVEEGYIIYQYIRTRPINNVTINCGIIFFDTESFNSALYEYENNFAGIMNSVILYGKGLRMFTVIRYNVLEQASISFKYSETYKPGVSSMRSGFTEIDGNLDNNIGLQIDINL